MFMKGYKRLVDGLERIELWMSTFLLGVLVLLVLIEVSSRYLFNRPFPWVLELSMFLITYIIFLAVPALYKGRSLITIEFIFKRLSEKIQETIFLPMGDPHRVLFHLSDDCLLSVFEGSNAVSIARARYSCRLFHFAITPLLDIDAHF